MKIWLLRTAKVLSLITIGFVLGTWFGFREGWIASYIVDAPPRGVMSMARLQAMEKQNLAPLKLFLNDDIDQGLYYYTIAQDQWWFTLLEIGVMGNTIEENTEYVRKLANYRLSNPASKVDGTIFDEVPKGKEQYANEYREMAIAHRDRIDRIKSAVEKYSTK